MTLPDMSSVTFLQASGVGFTPLTLPDGRVIDPCGLALALASLSARQVKALGLRTSGIYGPPGSTSSRSAVLQSSLENRLRARLLTLGSTLYTLTWKEWATPSGVSRSRLRASVPRISATETTGLVTPTTRDWKDSGADIKPRADGSQRLDQLPRLANLCGWPTPTVGNAMGSQSCEGMSATGRMPDGRKVAVALPHVAGLSGWPTPISNDALGSGYCYGPKKPDGSRAQFLKLPGAAAIAGPARLTATGKLLTGSDAGMAAGGQLNPALARYLMGYPAVWCRAAVSAWRSTPTPRQRRA